ncbi:glycoside hydrolase family 16 protein [Rhizorhabdus argentea]|uniref:glycoside hydrolase family 16 protein n=1 Tax=Rhizorhabdus argentea TaxID=1387174 RepID=UPI0030EF7AD8
MVRWLALWLAIMPAACGNARMGAPLDRTKLELRFAEDFSRTPTFYDAARNPQGRWKTNFAFGSQDPWSLYAWTTRTLRANAELQYYGDPTAGTGSIEWKPGALQLVAQQNPYRADPRTHGMPYLSALITTEKSFQQLYGYFEARVTMPVGTGLWPAFWLLPIFRPPSDPNQRQSGQEVDVFENVGRNGEIYATVHHDVGGKRTQDGERIPVDRIDIAHDYGVLVTSQLIIWYIDSHEVRRRANIDFHEPAYMLLNLAVGGEWPGAPDGTTAFPAKMTINRVRAYALKPGTVFE